MLNEGALSELQKMLDERIAGLELAQEEEPATATIETKLL